MVSEISKRYAYATFSLLKEEELLDLQQECKDLIKLFKEDKAVIELFDNRFIEKEERINLVDKSFSNIDVRFKNLIKVIVNNNRAKYLSEIFEGINSLINQHFGVLEGFVFSPFKLSEEQIKSIEEKISKLEGKKCSLSLIIDETLIGGVKVSISSHVYDNSIKNRIEKMKIDLL